jgi:hypothetical protein
MLKSSIIGLLAHPVERFHGMEEASGSSPLESTTLRKTAPACCFLVVEGGDMFLFLNLEIKTVEPGESVWETDARP